MFVVDICDHLLHYLIGQKPKLVHEIIPKLYQRLSGECSKLGIDPNRVVKIVPYRQCSTYTELPDRTFIVKIYCGQDDGYRYTLPQAKRHLRHELKHIRDDMLNKNPSEFGANAYELFGINL